MHVGPVRQLQRSLKTGFLCYQHRKGKPGWFRRIGAKVQAIITMLEACIEQLDRESGSSFALAAAHVEQAAAICRTELAATALFPDAPNLDAPNPD